MKPQTSSLQVWTQRFIVASAVGFVAYLLSIPTPVGDRTGVLLCVFGFICPMIFGMAYLLLPPYVGRTLVDYRLPGVHFALAFLGVGLLVVGWAVDGTGTIFALGTASWSAGVAVFVCSLIVTVGPVFLDRPASALVGGDRPQRSTRVATATIPVAMGYLLVGTVALLNVSSLFDLVPATMPGVIHYYLAGFGALLIFALGARLLIGFFHVTPPRPLVWLILAAGVLAPGVLGSALWIQPWFRIGAALTSVAMSGYLGLVIFAAVRTDRRTPGLYGIVLGAVAGVLAVASAALLAFGVGRSELLSVHRALILGGFFPLTIVGYAYQFFPVTNDQIAGTNVAYTTLTLGLLGVGGFLQGLGGWVQYPHVRTLGVVGSLLGALGYIVLLCRQFDLLPNASG